MAMLIQSKEIKVTFYKAWSHMFISVKQTSHSMLLLATQAYQRPGGTL